MKSSFPYGTLLTMLTSTWLATSLAFTIATISVYVMGNKLKSQKLKVKELEKSLKVSIDKCTAERQGRIRAQQALRKAVLQEKTDDLGPTYPMNPVGTVQSCFSTRNGTPRQPLLVPLARACLIFDPARVPLSSLEGLEEYSHIWIIYVFHLNTDLEKLWLEPSKSKIKAKVRVPRLKGEKKGLFATRSPHRPCPIGLTVAKVEAVKGCMVLLSGVDLVDGTPVLDVKPYLPYCDSIQESSVPDWVKADGMLSVASVTFSEFFSSALADCWVSVERSTLYSSPNEMKRLIEQVLSWDIRSSSQRTRTHKSILTLENNEPDSVVDQDVSSSTVIYHLILERLDISYNIDVEGNVFVHNVMPVCGSLKDKPSRCNYSIWDDKLA